MGVSRVLQLPPLQIGLEYCEAGSFADIMRILDRMVGRGEAVI